MPHGEIRLHSSRAAAARLVALFGGGGFIAAVAGFTDDPRWYILAAPGIGLGLVFTVIMLCCPLVITLSSTGLTARHRSGVGVVPASAIEAVGISKIGRVNYVTLWYDTSAIPALPASFGRYLRSMPLAEPGRIHIGAISQPDEAKRISELYRLVQEADLGEWRDHP